MLGHRGVPVAGWGQAPAYRAIAKFRKRHLSALGHLFVQALELCQAAGMVSLAGLPWMGRRCGRMPRGAKR